MAIEHQAPPGARAARPKGEVRYVGWQCRLYPNRPQARLLARCREGLRELSNALLGASNLKYSRTGRHMTGKEFRVAAQDWCHSRANRDPFPSTAIYQTAADMHAAFRNWHSKPRAGQGLPRFKPEGRAPGIYVPSAGTRFDGNRVRLPKFGWMRWRGGSLPARRLEGPKSRTTLGMVYGRVWRDAGERWMLSCVFECGPVDAAAATTEVAVVRQHGPSIAVELDGQPLEIPEPDHRTDADRRRMSRLQRRLSRCADGSKRRARALERFRNVARDIRNRERDRHHKLTTMIVLTAATIVVEGVRGEMLRQLEYKADWYGRQLQVRRGPPEPKARERPERARRPAPPVRSVKRESSNEGRRV